MRHSLLALSAASLCATLVIGFSTSKPATAQLGGSVPAFIRLQATTPGTTQTGHSAINGTAIAGQFVGGGAGLTNVNANLLDGLDSTAFLQSVPVPLSLTGSNAASILSVKNTSTSIGSVGILGEGGNATAGTGVQGVAISQVGRGVAGFATAASGIAYGGYFNNNTDNGYGVYAVSDGHYGVYGKVSGTNPDGIGGYFATDSFRAPAVVGVANGDFNSAHGGDFTSHKGDGIRAETGGIVGVRGTTSAGGALISYGGLFYSGDSTNGRGVGGVAMGGAGRTAGVFGEAYSNEGRGVVGYNYSDNGTTYGGYFHAYSNLGYGVYGSTDGLYGVFGETSGVTGINYGGRFETPSSSGRGVYGLATATGASDTPYGIRGQASTATDGYGVYAVGDSGASGVKSFRIDHPTDPQNKYLLHYSSESPFPQNFYSGNVTTDDNGYAWVELPEYFQSINANFKYQLTVLGKTFAQAIVSEEITGNRFQVRTNQPRIKVSWRIEADRNDLRIQHKRPVDVREKVGAERGHYQHPEYYNKPANLGMDYDRRRPAVGQKETSRP